MRLRVNVERLGALVAKDAFECAWVDRVEATVVFRRRCIGLPVFERLDVISQGREGEHIYAEVGVTVVYGPLTVRGLWARRLLSEVAGDAARGTTRVTSDDELKAWEARLAGVAAASAMRLSAEEGPILLTRTRAAREASAAYAARVGAAGSLGELEQTLNSQATDEQRAEARRLAGRGFWAPGLARVYQLAVLTMLVHGEEVEGRPRPFAKVKQPLDSLETFVWPANLLVDLLTRPDRPGGPLVTLGPELPDA